MSFPRSLLFVPGNRTEMFGRAWASDAQALLFDLEDSVPQAQKPAAREAVAGLDAPTGWNRPIFARLNAWGTADFESDVRAAVEGGVTGVMLPKVERGVDVRAVDQVLGAHERPDRPLKLILLLETPAGVLRVAELVDCGAARVAAFAFGAEDYRAGLGVDILDPVVANFARATVANAAAAARVPAIDAPELQVNDVDRLRAATRRARSLGFHAKFAIHPSQVPVIHEELAGGADRAWALRAVEAYERAASQGQGSVALDGRMIDEATMKRARDILSA